MNNREDFKIRQDVAGSRFNRKTSPNTHMRGRRPIYQSISRARKERETISLTWGHALQGARRFPGPKTKMWRRLGFFFC